MSTAAEPVRKPALRIIVTSERTRDLALAAFSGLLFALAFPLAGIAWAPLLGAGALFWTWQRASWKRALILGWLCGFVFFTISFWWWSTSIVTLVGPLAYAGVMVVAAIEACAIVLAAALTVLARARVAPALLPFAAALAFTIAEWLRSIGELGVPFAQLGTTQVETPLRALAAFIGTSGCTFVLFALGAYGAYALHTRTWRAFVACVVLVVAGTFAAWSAWPARTVAAPSVPVAAVQGNIAQSLKWQPGALAQAVSVYTAMTAQAAAKHPKLILWPETVIAIGEPGLNNDPELLTRFTQLATQSDATLVAGSVRIVGPHFYNTLFYFTPNGLTGQYDKRQLVPFAEHIPAPQFFGWIPYLGALTGGFSEGDSSGVLPTTAGLAVGSLICWESAFGDIAYDEVQNGAQVLAISTDDAWFGTSSGPYQHAQIAQMRAIETGRYVIRAAATGISGIIAPDGTWQARLPLGVRDDVFGYVGPPAGSFFAHFGPTRVWIAMMLVYALLLLTGRKREEAAD
jgi:apolipoprotein N-acyltransferase